MKKPQIRIRTKGVACKTNAKWTIYNSRYIYLDVVAKNGRVIGTIQVNNTKGAMQRVRRFVEIIQEAEIVQD